MFVPAYIYINLNECLALYVSKLLRKNAKHSFENSARTTLGYGVSRHVYNGAFSADEPFQPGLISEPMARKVLHSGRLPTSSTYYQHSLAREVLRKGKAQYG